MTLPMLENILNQADSLENVVARQYGAGRAALKQAAAWINAAPHLKILAIGASYAAAIPFTERLRDMGRQVWLEDAGEYLHYRRPADNPRTVYLLISRSGDTIEIVRLLEKLKGHGPKVIGLANVGESALAQGADLFLNMGSAADHLVAVQTYTATLLVLHMLAQEIAGTLDEKDVRQKIEGVPGRVQTALDHYRSAAPGWKDHFRKYKAVYLLGRNASKATAIEGGLIFHEAAWYPANGFYSAGHFRHGPWEVVDEDFLGFVFAQRGPTYDLDLTLANDLAAMGGEIKLISAERPQELDGRVAYLPGGGGPAELSPILEVLPLQFFVVEFALWQGHTPGEFRVSTPITLAEKGVTFAPANGK